MRRLTSKMLRFRPLFQAAIVLYLLGAVFFTTVHQHHGNLHGSDCALCAMSHMPAVLAPAVERVADCAIAGALIPVPDDQGWANKSYQASHSRAPPQT